MAVRERQSRQDRLTALLPNLKVDQRISAWLTLVLMGDGNNLSIDSIGLPDIRDKLADAIIKAENGYADDLTRWASEALLPVSNFDWIVENNRQYLWVLKEFADRKIFNGAPSNNARISRLMLIAIFDYWNGGSENKLNTIREIENNWNRHVKSDKIFDWFNEYESERCQMADEWIKKNKSVFHNFEIKTREDILIYFDSHRESEDAIKYFVEKVKRRWRQKNDRNSNNNKKQYNFVLSNTAIARLDRLAKKYDLSRTDILDVLLFMEEKKKAYIPERLATLSKLTDESISS